MLCTHCTLEQDAEGASQEWAAVQKATLPFERVLEVGASRVEVLASAGEPHCWLVSWCCIKCPKAAGAWRYFLGPAAEPKVLS